MSAVCAFCTSLSITSAFTNSPFTESLSRNHSRPRRLGANRGRPRNALSIKSVATSPSKRENENAPPSLIPLSSPPQRYNDFSNHAVDAIRITHCRVQSQQLAEQVSSAVRSKKASLSQLASLLSICDVSRRNGGDSGWYNLPLEWRSAHSRQQPDGINNLPLLQQDELTSTVIHPEFLQHILKERPGTLNMARLSYGYEIFTVDDVRHTFTPSSLGIRRGPGFPVTPNMRRTSPKKPSIEPMSYYIQTFGCQMNALDSERIAAALQEKGYHPVANPNHSAIYLLNTCALRDHAEQKVYSYLGPHAQRKWDAPSEVTVIVAGCVAQQEGDRLLARVPEVDIVMGPQYANRIGDLLEDFRLRMTQIVAVEPVHIHEDISKPVRTSKVTAWVNVMYGCLEKCTYCVVPNTRGVEQSRSMEAIRREMEQLGKDGYREVVLLGQNVDAYGRDLYPKRTFAELLRFVHDVEGVERIRFTTGHPRYISDNLLETVESLPKVMEHFHIPPQSGDNRVLKEMRRGYTRERYIDIARRIRERLPDASICADTIVGFPGETEAAFRNTVKLIDEVVFDANMVRAYSARPNTEAGIRVDQVDEDVKAQRLGILNRKMREQAEIRSKRFLGRVVEVLVEGKNEKREGEMKGRERSNRVVLFKGAGLEGKIVQVLVEEAYAFSLRGRIIGEPR